MSTMMENRPPFKVLLGHALVRDQNGDEMHKSRGNAIEFNGAADSGYELFVERKDKLSLEDQAKKELPAGFLAVREDQQAIDGKLTRVVKGKYPPIGADVIRWMYCRQNPAANINIGPGPADEIRARFHLKLLNVYAFFCNYARLDGFDPHHGDIPLAQRPDIDRWILSDLQKLVQVARKAFESYNVMDFCHEAERFVDDKLSNWYVRRNRRRFWKSDQGADKQAAYQTLHTVLETLTRLLAPVIPFFTESMYQNLVVQVSKARSGQAPAPSVHLCEYPVVRAELIDEQLSSDMEALLRLVSLGSAARNAVKIKVRQPLAELKVQPADESERRAVERFGDQIAEELNVKKVTIQEGSAGPLLTQEVKPNMRVLGPRFGAQLKEAQSILTSAPPAELIKKAQKGEPFELGGLTFEPTDVLLTNKAPEGWSGWADRGTQVLLDARITEELAREGMARDVIRQVQEMRKQSGLQMEDRISLYLASPAEALQSAIDSLRDTIAAETLTARWLQQPPGTEKKTVKVEGKDLTIALAKI